MATICRASRADAALILAIISDVALLVLFVLLILLLFDIPPPRFVTANIALIATPILLILAILALAILGSGCIEILSTTRFAEGEPRLIARSSYAFATGIKTLILTLFTLVLIIVHVIVRKSFFFKRQTPQSDAQSPRHSSPEYTRERRSGTPRTATGRSGTPRTGTGTRDERHGRRSGASGW